jgi:hypothetical protein
LAKALIKTDAVVRLAVVRLAVARLPVARLAVIRLAVISTVEKQILVGVIVVNFFYL